MLPLITLPGKMATLTIWVETAETFIHSQWSLSEKGLERVQGMDELKGDRIIHP